jgi:hypothetical protein
VSQLAGVSACSRAATAEEAAFRIDYPLAAARNTRVVALDPAAEEIVRKASALEWGQARFYVASDPGDEWITMDGETVHLGDEIAESNTVVMVSTDGSNAEAAGTIGAACKVRGIMTAGLMELRPHARILLVPAEEDDLVELLAATRA